MNRLCALALVLLSLPVLQGAGCSAHYWPKIHGKVNAGPEQSGKTIVVIFRKHEPGVQVCTKDWAPCLRSGWLPLRACRGEDEELRGPLPPAPVAAAGDFKGCAGMLGVDYRADVAAFIDENGNGALDSGEHYGVYEGSPLTRDMEASALPLEIAISQVMP